VHLRHIAVLLAALAAALAFALSSFLKHVSAGQVPMSSGEGVGGFGRFIRGTLAHPLWLGGIGADVVGLALQLIALHLGALAVVQPLLITGLVFALVFRSRFGGRVSPREIGWAVVVGLCLVGFLLVAHVRPPVDHQGVDKVPAAIACGVGVVLGTACVLAARRVRGGRSAALIGITVGATYAATAALLKTLTDLAFPNPLHLFVSWQLYTVIVVGALGLVLNQMAFQAGPLSSSLPAIATVDPLLSVVIGVALYDERIRHSAWALVALTALLLVLGWAVIQLARAEARETVDGRPA
jgi:hypothetical protein